MNFLSILVLLGGLAFFLYGMHAMSSGLEKIAGGRLQKVLKKLTSNPFKSLALGAIITIAIQSSSALTVMLVGLVNSGIMQFSQTIGVLMGSNIGTTLTAWLLSLSGISGDRLILQLCKPEYFSLAIALVGVIMIMMSKKQRHKDIGSVFVGFAVLIYGMKMMSDAVSPLADMPEFTHLLTAFNNPILGVIVGAVFTGIIQSSAASVGVLQALSLTGSITYGMAIPIIMGQNIGTCVTALISSIGVNKNAKRVAVVHITFNIIGTIILLTLFYIADAIFDLAFVNQAISPVGIAAVHSIFNIVTTIILFPFMKQLEKIAIFLVRDGNKKEEYAFLDDRLLNTPAFAVSECSNMSHKMADTARDSMFAAIAIFDDFTEKKADSILVYEDQLDKYEDNLGTYLVKLSSKNLMPKDSNEVAKLLRAIGDFERIGDHAVNIMETAREMHEKEVHFSAVAVSDLHVLTSALRDILNITIDAYVNDSIETAKRVEPLEEVIDALINDIKNRHVTRLQTGECTIEMGFILSDLLTNYERVSDHCSNIAVAIIEMDQGGFDSHQYLNERKRLGSDGFDEAYEEYRKKYSLE